MFLCESTFPLLINPRRQFHLQIIGIFYKSIKTSAQTCLKNVDLFIASRDASNAENIGKTCIL